MANTPIFALRLDPTLQAQIRRLAVRKGVTPSDVVRALLEASTERTIEAATDRYLAKHAQQYVDRILLDSNPDNT